MSDTIIKFDNVSFAYELEDEGIVNAVNDFSLEVPEGQFLAVLGHNGCGKSTLGRCIIHLLDQTGNGLEALGLGIQIRDGAE